MEREDSETAFKGLISHLKRTPQFLDQMPIQNQGPKELNELRDWLDQLYQQLKECGPMIHTPLPGHGLDWFWLRSFVEFVSCVEDSEKKHGLKNWLFNSGDSFGMRIRSCSQDVYEITKFRRGYVPGGVASLLSDEEPSPLALLRSLAQEYEQQWIDADLPPRKEGGMRLVTRFTDSQTELERTLGQFGHDAGALLLRTADELLIPETLRKAPSLADWVYAVFRGGATFPEVLFDRFCREWLPTVCLGYGTEHWLYPGSLEDDQKRFNLGVRRARCAMALVDALEGVAKQAEVRETPPDQLPSEDLPTEWFSLYQKVFLLPLMHTTDVNDGEKMSVYQDLMRFNSLSNEMGKHGEQLGIDSTLLFHLAGSMRSLDDFGRVTGATDGEKDAVFSLAKRIEARLSAPAIVPELAKVSDPTALPSVTLVPSETGTVTVGPPYSVDENIDQIRIDGQSHNVVPEAARMASLLLEKQGEWVSMADNEFTKPSVTRRKLPDKVQALIESETGKGYRLKTSG